MVTPKESFYEVQASTIIKNLAKRKIEGFYCANVEDAKKKLAELLARTDNGQPAKKSVAYGGSMTLDENGFKDAVKSAGHELIVREDYKTPEEIKELKAKTVNADAFLMSTNAITLDGELINIDGRGNRVSFLIYGP